MNNVRTIENERLIVSVADHGGELVRIYDKIKKNEVIWDANPLFWGRHAPILFPNVGRHYLDTYRYDGMEYATKQHGFARDSEFTYMGTKLVEEGIKITHTLLYDEHTLSYFPFAFRLTVSHILMEHQVKVTWRVDNLSDKKCYFTIGGHPAFAFTKENKEKDAYELYFPSKNQVLYKLIEHTSGTVINDEIHTLSLIDGYYPLSESLFEHDALVFDESQIDEVLICKKGHIPYVGLKGMGFTNFGIWSVKDAPFVCLEPWVGRCDNSGFTGEISEKTDVIMLEEHEVFSRAYEITIY